MNTGNPIFLYPHANGDENIKDGCVTTPGVTNKWLNLKIPTWMGHGTLLQAVPSLFLQLQSDLWDSMLSGGLSPDIGVNLIC